jgi:hypothetical protein
MRQRWDNLAEFLRATGCPASNETARKLIYDNQPVSAVSLIAIAQDLGCTPDEIRGMLTTEAKRYIQVKAGEQDYAARLAALIGSGAGEGISGEDQVVIDALHAISARNPGIHGDVAYYMAAHARVLGMAALERKLKKMRGSSRT